MKKILLINPGHDDEHEAHKHVSFRKVHRDPPPIALLAVGSYLSEHGIPVEIVDTHVEPEYERIIAEKVESGAYLFAGMTVIIGKFLRNAKGLTKLIRSKAPLLPVVWGGVLPSIYPEECLREYGPDFIVRYEGEETALELARALSEGKAADDVKGISFLRDGKVVHTSPRPGVTDLDRFPTPRWELLGKAFNLEQVPYFYLLMSSRGCPFNCYFCYKHALEVTDSRRAPSWRFRSAEHIIAEVEHIHASTGTRVFTFGDDNFLVNKTRALRILEHFRSRGFYIEECISHLGCIDEELIDAMGGIVQTLSFSVESASPRLLKLINKQLPLERVADSVARMRQNNMVSNVVFIVGLPTETDEDLRMNVELMLSLKSINAFVRGNIYLYLPLPKTRLFDMVESMYGVTLPSGLPQLEEANFWVKDIEDRNGRDFRPWLDEDRYRLLVRYGFIFNAVFRLNNREIDPAAFTLMEEYPLLGELFRGCEAVNRPETDYIPYVLDNVLAGDAAPIRSLDGL